MADQPPDGSWFSGVQMICTTLASSLAVLAFWKKATTPPPIKDQLATEGRVDEKIRSWKESSSKVHDKMRSEMRSEIHEVSNRLRKIELLLVSAGHGGVLKELTKINEPRNSD